MPVPLHSHSHFSALDGLAKPEEMLARAQELNFSAIGLTDHDIVAGHYDFYKTISEGGLKPILGIETYQTPGVRQTNFGYRNHPETKAKADNFHLILLAMNDVGLRNLWALNSDSHSEGFYYNGRCDWELLEKYNEGIICTSACMGGMLAQAVSGNLLAGIPDQIIKKYLGIFGDRFYVEVSTYGEHFMRETNLELANIADQYGVPIVYANDAHYAYPGQYHLHEVVLCMQYQEKVSKIEQPHHAPDLYIMGDDEIYSALNHLGFSKSSEAVDQSDEIAARVTTSFPGRGSHAPVFIPESKWANSREMLFDLAKEGYDKLIIQKGKDNEDYMERFKKEISIIFEADLTDYFLIVRDYISFANDRSYLVGPGRGSVGGSLIAYLIGITLIDPVQYGLVFERFYNIGRAGSLPDIDNDFPTFAREEILAYLVRTYGEDYVADIGTVTSYQGRNAIQKLGSTFEFPFGDIKAISQVIEGAIESGLQPDWEALDKLKELEPWKQKYPKLFEYAKALHGNTVQYGIHASGIVVSDVPLKENYPVRWHAKEKKVVTQWDMRTADKLGYMKVDVLGLRNLDTLMELNNILTSDGKEPVNFYEVADQQHPDEMYELLEKGITTGIFQIEDGANAKNLCRKIKPRNVEELALITALNRPGPQIAGSDVRYIRGRNGQEVMYTHPVLEQVASETYGEFIYQEQVINYFMAIGYTPEEADVMRGIIGKKLRKEMEAEYPLYMERASKLMSKGTAQEIWDNIENFSKYAFNKSHSIAYGIILLWTLYAKFYHPREFYLASIRTLTKDGKKDKIPSYIREAPRMGVRVYKPELNKSKAEASVQEGGIRYGYADIKGIGMMAAKWLEKHQPFSDYDQLLEESQKEENKMTLKNGLRRVAITKGHIASIRNLNEKQGEELLDLEENLLGVALSDDSDIILDQYHDLITAECNDFEDLLNANGEASFLVAGVISDIKETKTKKGTPMAWVIIRNGDRDVKVSVWQEALNRYKFGLRKRTAGIFAVKTNSRGANMTYMKILHREN